MVQLLVIGFVLTCVSLVIGTLLKLLGGEKYQDKDAVEIGCGVLMVLIGIAAIAGFIFFVWVLITD